MIEFKQYSSKYLQLLLIVSLVVFTNACSGGGSSNSDNSSNTECSDGFGDASRCEAREGLN